MAIAVYFPIHGPHYKDIKRLHQRNSYNGLMSMLRKLGVRSANDHHHPTAVYTPGVY